MIKVSHIEKMEHGVSVNYYFDNRIPIVTMQHYSREAVDTAVDVINDLAIQWDVDTPYTLGLELMNSRMLTPYSRERFGDTATTNPHVKGRYVLIVPRDFIGQAIQLYFNLEYKTRTVEAVAGRAFHQREPALLWLAELLDPQP